MHVHLDLVGGIAGDMFVAAVIDAWPELAEGAIAAMRTAGLPDSIGLHVKDCQDRILTGKRFEVIVSSDSGESRHAHFGDIRERLAASALQPAVIKHAIDIFTPLAEAESKVHGVSVDKVVLHEVGAWDSIADIVAAAFLINALGVDSWSVSALPIGSGRVDCVHGSLPVPAPAAALLLEGFVMQDDGLDGERVTPTGAALLRYLKPGYRPPGTPIRFMRSGIGFGKRKFERISNVLRVLAFEKLHAPEGEKIAVIHFEVDDQPAEDLAIGLEHIRNTSDVVDVLQLPAFGKKGRMSVQIQVLTMPDSLYHVIDKCFRETTTLGLRWHLVQRAVLDRDTETYNSQDSRFQVKVATRPGGTLTAKTEIDNVAAMADGAAERANLRHEAEHVVLKRRLDNEPKG